MIQFCICVISFCVSHCPVLAHLDSCVGACGQQAALPPSLLPPAQEALPLSSYPVALSGHLYEPAVSVSPICLTVLQGEFPVLVPI